MELLFISHKYPPSIGGMEKQSFELINGMKNHFKVHAIVYEGKESRFHFFGRLNKRIRQVLQAHPGISVIHFNDGLMAACGLLLFKGFTAVKRTVTLHGLDVVFPGVIYQRFILPKFNQFDLIFAVSKATADACEAGGINKDKIVVVNNGVDTTIRPTAGRPAAHQLLLKRFNIDSAGKKILVAMGRPVKRKGFSWFIKRVLPSLDDRFILLIVGPVHSNSGIGTRIFQSLPSFIRIRIELFLGFPGDEREIAQLISLPTIKNRAIRLGKLPFEEITTILAAADAFIMPNIEIDGDMEGFGLVCLEACMCGARVFAAASGGITDAIHTGKNGILLPPGHIASWIHALNQFAYAPESVKLCPEQVISYTAENFSWEKMTSGYYAHFLKLARS